MTKKPKTKSTIFSGPSKNEKDEKLIKELVEMIYKGKVGKDGD